MNKRIVTICLSFALAALAWGRPAKPGPVIITEDDGTERTVYLHGDEYFHYMTLEEDNRWVEMREGVLREVPALSEEQVQSTRRENMQRRNVSPQKLPIELNIAPRGLVILAQFSDLSFKEANNLPAYNAMFNGDAYSYNGATGSARKYFIDQSFGQYQPQFDVVGPVTVSQTQSYYGQNDYQGNDMHPDEMIIEACRIADTAYNVDFSQYDNDNDGYVDFVYVVYAGRGEADGGAKYTIWPHTSIIYSGGWGTRVELDGKLLGTYACSNELQGLGFTVTRDGIGAFCHEFSHVLGLPDHYATNYINNKQTGNWDIMCSGSYNNSSNTPAAYTAYERFFMGWITPTLLNEPYTCDSLLPLITSGESFIITESGQSNLVGNNPSPALFYMLENRQKVGWDSYIPGHGLLITRINYSYMKWTTNTVNNTESDLGYDIMEADGKTPTRGVEGSEGKQGDAFPTATVKAYSPFENCPITDIKEQHSRISFRFKGGYDRISEIAKTKAADKYGEDFNTVVAVYTSNGQLLRSVAGTTDILNLNDLPQGFYIVALSNGKKTKGVKLYVK